MFDKRLIHAINCGRCFVLVGAGLSAEMGYADWWTLADKLIKKLEAEGIAKDLVSYRALLKADKLPEVFQLAEDEIGSRQPLIDFVKQELAPLSLRKGFAYEAITRWPFACYLTTNYDDEIEKHLLKLGTKFRVLQNQRADLAQFRDGASGLICKLHSDLQHPDLIALTSGDYNRLYRDSHVLRDKLRQIFETFDILILGHRLADVDITEILKIAQTTANLDRPIYLVVEDMIPAMAKEYYSKYNIVAMSFGNSDRSFSEFRRILNIADKFIVPRTKIKERYIPEPRPLEEIEQAIGISIYRRLQGSLQSNLFEPFVLRELKKYPEGLEFGGILATPTIAKFDKKTDSLESTVKFALDRLKSLGLISHSGERYCLTQEGSDKNADLISDRDTIRELAIGQFELELSRKFPRIAAKEIAELGKLAEKVLVSSFERRGLVVANQVFSGTSIRSHELSDIFGNVSDAAATLDGFDLKAGFVEAMHQFLVEPTENQKNYLAAISQGYFLYHFLGNDPSCAKLRWDIFRQTVWIVDSSVVLPLLAKGCHNHDYATNLFNSLRSAGATVLVTKNLLKEAHYHLKWAKEFIQKNPDNSIEFLRAATVQGDYKQNLFIDGYIQKHADGLVQSFGEYQKRVLSEISDINSFFDYVKGLGISVLSAEEFDGFSHPDYDEIENLQDQIRTDREYSATYRSEFQVSSEAEVAVIVRKLRDGTYSVPDLGYKIDRVYFVSQSMVLNRVTEEIDEITWRPEALYRYISALPDMVDDPNLLQQCMLHEYFYAGVSFVDQAKYERFFGPGIDSARLVFEEEKERYIEEVEGSSLAILETKFNATPPLEKQLFVHQMAWNITNRSKMREDELVRRLAEAELRAKNLEAEKETGWKERKKRVEQQEASERRNANDPKHVAKRLKQAKKRKKKK